MEQKIVKRAINSGTQWGYVNGDYYKYGLADLILIYTDGTWEKIFEYRASCPGQVRRWPLGYLENKPREYAIAKVHELYNDGKIEGVFMD